MLEGCQDSPVDRDDPAGSFRFFWIYVFTDAIEKGNLQPILSQSHRGVNTSLAATSEWRFSLGFVGLIRP